MAIEGLVTEHSFKPGAAMAAEALTDLEFLAASELVVEVLRTGATVRETLAQDADYAVTVPAGGAWGTVRALAAWAADDEWYVRRETPRTQSEAWSPFNVNPTAIARLADKDMRIEQEQDREIGRAFKAERGAEPVEFADLSGAGNGDIVEFYAGKLQVKAVSAFAGKVYGGAAVTGRMTPVVLRDPGGVDTLATLALGTGSELVGYKRSATGLLRTGFDKLKDYADIRDWIGGNWNQAHDYTAELQAACNELSWINNTGMTNVLHLPAGTICHTGITLGRMSIEGAGSNLSFLKYVGAPGGTAITARRSQVGLRKIWLDADDLVRPATHLDYTADLDPDSIVDYQTIFDEVFFGPASGSALKTVGIVNMLLIRPRFHNAARCMEITSLGTASVNRAIKMIGGTIDLGNSSAGDVTVQEVFKFNYSGADELLIEWDTGRIEGPTALLANTFSLLRPTGVTSAHPGSLSLRNCGIDFVGALSGGQVPGYINVDGAGSAPTLVLHGVENNRFGKAFIGTGVSAFFHNPTLSTQQPIYALINPNFFNGNLHQYPREINFGELPLKPVMSGNSNVGFLLAHPTGGGFGTGSGAPEGVVTGNVGMIYTDASGIRYRKNSGTGTTGWRNVTEGTTDTAAHIASTAATINATAVQKYAGRNVFDTTNNRLMIASGSNPTDAWYVADASLNVVPV